MRTLVHLGTCRHCIMVLIALSNKIQGFDILFDNRTHNHTRFKINCVYLLTGTSFIVVFRRNCYIDI